ncbi:sulfotransferase, partial [Haematococcus lacustris]
MAWLVTLNIWPSVLLARRLYWACPFIPHIFQQMGPVRGWALRIGFEASYCIN